jgi:hypothetical protein
MSQLDIRFGERLRDAGIQVATDHADRELSSWSAYAFDHLKEYLRNKPSGFSFMIEDFRDYLKVHLVAPPSARAFGAVAVRASREHLIGKAGYELVKNPRAHRTPATVWKKL